MLEYLNMSYSQAVAVEKWDQVSCFALYCKITFYIKECPRGSSVGWLSTFL